MNKGSRILSAIILCLFISTKLSEANNFPNFYCGDEESKNEKDEFEDVYDSEVRISRSESCSVYDINSSDELQTIFEKFWNYDFAYYNYYSNARSAISSYNALKFQNSKFENFPFGSFDSLSHIKLIRAENVGLSKLSRDDFRSFISLKVLLLSNNNLTQLENIAFFHLQSLKLLNLSYNQIESISSNAFDDCSKNLSIVDLSNNRIKSIHESIFNMLGQNSNSKIYLGFNDIEEIVKSAPKSSSVKTLDVLDMGNNKMKVFDFNCSTINKLLLNDNNLELFETYDCKIIYLDVTNNLLTNIEAPKAQSLFVSDNIHLRNMSFNVAHLEKFEIRNIPAGIINYDLLRNASYLTVLDATNTYIGTPKIHTFSEMTLLTVLKLRNTGLSNIEYGMFSHQTKLLDLDISYNNLRHIEIEKLSNLRALQSLDVSGNNLTHFDDIDGLRKLFPYLSEIGIDDNNWNCSYLSKISTALNSKSIYVKQPASPTKDSTNINGIKCLDSSQAKIATINDTKDVIAQKMNEIIEQINADRVKSNDMKYDSDFIRSELLHHRQDIFEIKTELSKLKFAININSKNDSSSINIDEIKRTMEELNNYNLDKQKYANDQLQLKLDKLEFDLLKNSHEHEKFVQKNNLRDLGFDKESAKYDYSKSTNESDSKIAIILLTFVITVMFVIGVIYGYSKLKNLISKRNENLCVRARSTNTVNTTVEMPFDDQVIS